MDNTKNPLKNTHNSSAGFTITELNLSIVIVGILLVGLLAIFVNFFTIMTRTNSIVDMTSESQGLLRTMVEELRYGAGVRESNTIADANAPSGSWDTSDENFVIVIALPAVDSERNYIVDDDTGNPYMNELVYYREGSVMYKRVLANPSATDNLFTTSCPVAVSNSSCPPDRILVENASDMDFELYDQDNVLTTDPTLARSIKITLSLAKDTFGAPLSYDNSIRITLRNTY